MIKRLLFAIGMCLALASAATAQNVVTLSPVPKLSFFTVNGAPASGYELFTYIAGTTTKQNTYTSANGATPNTNAIILDTLGSANVWLTPGAMYKFVLAPPGSSDPPTSPIWTVDNIQAPFTQGQTGTGTVVTTSSLITLLNQTICVNAGSPNVQTLPVSPIPWEQHIISDCSGNASTNPITVSGNGNNIDGAASYTLGSNYQSISVQWTGTIWKAQALYNPAFSTQTALISGTSFTTPTGARQFRIREVGGGGGGGGSGTTGQGNGVAGGNTSFNSIVAAGGLGASGLANQGGNGGTGGSGTASFRSAGNGGASASGASATSGTMAGGTGGGSLFGGGAIGSGNATAGANAVANTGAGGGGGGVNAIASGFAGGGGGSGEYAEIIINNPTGSYTYAIGSGGAGGTAGTSGSTGGNGGSGQIVVTVMY